MSSRWYDREDHPSHYGEEDYSPPFGGEDFAGIGGPVNWLHPGEPVKHGHGPRSYKRADESIHDEVIVELTHHPRIDAVDIEVEVQGGEVTLLGYVDNEEMKRLAEAAADSVSGVKNVYNRIRVKAKAA